MAECISEKKVKTRKRHRCHGCLSIFPAKTEMISSVNTDGGEIYTLYFCKDCYEYIEKYPKEFEDGEIYPGDVRESDNYFAFLNDRLHEE